MRVRVGSLAILSFAVAASAWAHPGHDGGAGFLHPFSGIDHLLAMIGVGMWAWLDRKSTRLNSSH